MSIQDVVLVREVLDQAIAIDQIKDGVKLQRQDICAHILDGFASLPAALEQTKGMFVRIDQGGLPAPTLDNSSRQYSRSRSQFQHEWILRQFVLQQTAVVSKVISVEQPIK